MSDFQQLVTQFKKQFEPELAQEIQSEGSGNLVQAAQYSLMVGGKRIRPLLVKAAAEAVGITDSSWLAPAIAIEMVHTYSLIHDDLPAMDDDDLRRGQATCHKQFGEAIAILAGDGLQMKAISCISQSDSKWLNDAQKLQQINSLTLASGFSGMVAGQALDLDGEGKKLSLDEITNVHARKTGALIVSAIEMGCFCHPDLPIELLDKGRKFGQAIGLAFQVIDDILDIEGSTEVLGKSQGADIDHDKSTFPALMGLEEARLYANKLYLESLEQLKDWPGDTTTLKLIADFVLSRNH